MTDQEIDVRRARAEDIPGLVDSSSRLFAEDAGTRDPSIDVHWPREHGAASITEALGNPARLVLVAEGEGMIVGHLMGSVADPSAMRPVRCATLISLYLRPERRGAHGGTRMVEEFLAWAEGQGAEQVEVTAYSANTDALRFYGRHGFRAHSVTLRRVDRGNPTGA